MLYSNIRLGEIMGGKQKNLKKILHKSYPSGDLPFFISTLLLIFIVILAAILKSKYLFNIGVLIALAMFFYATIWMSIYNHIVNKKLKKYRKSFGEEDKGLIL